MTPDETANKAAYESVPEPGRSNRQHSEKRQRSEIVAIRLTPEEKQRFAALAERHRMSLPEMFRLAAEVAENLEAVHG